MSGLPRYKCPALSGSSAMIPTKILATVLGIALAVGGVAAGAGAVPFAASEQTTTDVTDAEVDATWDNGTVTVTAMDTESPIANATVEVNDAEAVTDENGTATVELDPNESQTVEIEIEHDRFEAELEYDVTEDGLVLLSEEYEYERGADDRGESEVAEEHQSETGDENQSDVADADDEREDTDDEEDEDDEEDGEADEDEELPDDADDAADD